MYISLDIKLNNERHLDYSLTDNSPRCDPSIVDKDVDESKKHYSCVTVDQSFDNDNVISKIKIGIKETREKVPDEETIPDRKETAVEKRKRTMVLELDNPTIVSELSTTISIGSGSNLNHAPNDDGKDQATKKMKTLPTAPIYNNTTLTQSLSKISIKRRPTAPLGQTKSQYRNAQKKRSKRSKNLMVYLYSVNLIPQRVNVINVVAFIYDYISRRNHWGQLTCLGPDVNLLATTPQNITLSDIVWKISFSTIHFDLYCNTEAILFILSKEQHESYKLYLKESRGKQPRYIYSNIFVLQLYLIVLFILLFINRPQ